MTTNSSVAMPVANQAAEKKLANRDLVSIFWRSCMLDGSWNYER